MTGKKTPDYSVPEEFLNEAQLTRFGAMSLAVLLIDSAGAKAEAVDLVSISDYILNGDEAFPSSGEAPMSFQSLFDASEAEDAPGTVSDVEGLEALESGQIVEDQDGDSIACVKDEKRVPRWLYIDQPGAKTMTSAEVVFEGKGPWRIAEPTAL